MAVLESETAVSDSDMAGPHTAAIVLGFGTALSASEIETATRRPPHPVWIQACTLRGR